MLQRLIYNSFELKIARKNSQLLFNIPTKAPLCQQCGSRINSRYKVPDKRNIYERTFSNKYGLFNYKIRCYTTQVDAQKKNEQFENVKEKNPIETTKKINVKLKTSELKRLFTLAEPEKWTLAGAIGFLIVSSSVTMAIPFSLGKVLDIIYSSTSDLSSAHEKLDTLCLMLCGVFLVGGLCNFGRVYLMSISGQRMTQSLRRQVYRAIMRQEPAWFGKTSTGELVNRLSADTQLVGRNLSQNVSDGLRSLFMVGAGTGMMFYMSPSLALIGLCVVPPVSMLAVIYGRFVRGITRQLQDALAESSELAEEKISNIKTVKAFSKEEAECQTYGERIENLLKLAYKESLAVGSFYGLNPRILILDEATSALDAYSEYLVDKALKEISKDRTVLTIAHRLSTIQSADEVAVMENGVIVEKGPYHKLIAKPDGFFKELINRQTFVKKNREKKHDVQQ